jgi:hypothetical protein
VRLPRSRCGSLLLLSSVIPAPQNFNAQPADPDAAKANPNQFIDESSANLRLKDCSKKYARANRTRTNETRQTSNGVELTKRTNNSTEQKGRA